MEPEPLKQLSAQWQAVYGEEAPQWIESLKDLQDVSKATSDCQERIGGLLSRLEQEKALLKLLDERSGDTTSSGQDCLTLQEEETPAIPSLPLQQPSPREKKDDSPGHSSRSRALGQVDRREEKLARRVKERIKASKHWSISGIERVLDFQGETKEEEGVPFLKEEGETSSKKTILSRRRSRSESSTFRFLRDRGKRGGSHSNSPVAPSSKLASQVEHAPSSSPPDDHPQESGPMEIPSINKEAKRLSNGTHPPHLIDDDENDLIASVKTIVGDDTLYIKGSLLDSDPNMTLKRDSFYTNTSGEKTPTDPLTETLTEEISPLGAAAEGVPRPLGLEMGLFEAGQFFQGQDTRYDEEEDERSMGEGDDAGSFNEIESSGFHSNFQNLAESTLTYILRDTIFASRSNSMSSLNDRRSMSPEPTTPLGGVNLRPNSGRIKERNRAAHVIDEDCMDEEKLQKMLLELQDSSPCQSPSPVSTSSDPSSPTHLVPYDHMTIRQPLSARSSRMYPVRRETVVVHGEVLVIRKLVVAGIVAAEKAYLDCLNVIKEFYRKPLLALTSTSQAVISETDVNTIFYRVEDLHTLHSTLHEMLEALLPDWGMHSCVGGFFLELCKNLKLYKDYVEMYRRSLDCLERSKVDPNFKKFLEDVRSTVSSQSQFKDVPNVNELLRKPIERLQSYSLVLTDLCQHTPEAHNDFSVLKQSLNVMSDFIASTHDPRAFQQLSGGFNRELVKQELVVELLERSRKIRRLFLFHDVLVSAKEKSPSTGHGEGVKLEPKWYLPLHNLRFHPPEAETLRPVPVTSDQELSVIKSRIAELKAQLNREFKEKRSSTLDKDASFKRNFKFIGTKPEKLRKKLQEQQVSYWIASPSLPLRLYGTNGKRYVFLLHNEDERESWISAIKKLQPKAVQSVTLSQFELQDLLSRQKVHLTRDQDEVIEVHTDEDEYLTGILRVHVTSAKDMKNKQNYGLHCALEFDEYSRFDRKARTLPVNMDMTTLMVTWDQDFEIETVGAHMMKAMIFYKYLLKEEVCAVGKLKLPVKELKSSKRCKVDIQLHPQGVLTLVVEYFTSMASMGKRPALLSSGVFGFPMDIVAKREHHDIPLIVQTCVDEVERRGMSEVGIYRVAGVLRDVQELRMAFDTDYIHAQQIAFETDIHAVAGLLKRYFRELPDPLFTDDLYMSFVQALALADPEAREQSLVTLLHSLPKVNFKTAVFLFRHLRSVAAESETNKMTLNNLATLFGPNLLRPGSQSAAAAFDVMSPVNVLMFFLVCPIEVYDDPNSSNSAPSSASKKSKKRQELLPLEGEDTSSISSSQSTGFVSTALPPPASSPSHTVHASSSTPSLPLASVASPVSPTSVASSPTVVGTTTSASSGGGVVSTASVSVSSASTPLRYKQSAI